MGEYISTETAAKDLDLALRTIQEWCKRKKVKAYKMGKEWRIPRSEWETFKKRIMTEAA